MTDLVTRIRQILNQDTYQTNMNQFGSLTLLSKYMSLFNAQPNSGAPLNQKDASLFANYTGPGGSKAVQIAKSQLGVREASGNNDGADILKYLKGNAQADYSDIGKRGDAWCAGFASWSYKMANNGKNAPWGYDLSVSGIREKAQGAGVYSTKEAGYTPQQGDLLVLKRNGASHVAIIDKIENGTIYTIEGNYQNKVAEVQRNINNPEIDGYVRVEEWNQKSFTQMG